MANNKIKSFRQHLDEQHGKPGSKTRDKYEEGFEAFKLGVLLLELRSKEGLTQEQLAKKCGTTKSYISRIENNASDPVNVGERTAWGGDRTAWGGQRTAWGGDRTAWGGQRTARGLSTWFWEFGLTKSM